MNAEKAPLKDGHGFFAMNAKNVQSQSRPGIFANIAQTRIQICLLILTLLLACSSAFIFQILPPFETETTWLSALSSGLLAIRWTEAADSAVSHDKAVLTSSGHILGHKASHTSHVVEFLGIPFGRAPISDLRFAPPQAFESDEIFTASNFSVDCPANVAQASASTGPVPLAGATAAKFIDATQQYGATVGEDCLKLNVWVRPGGKREPKAVLFWLYGGGFTKGTTNSFLYDGEFLAETQDVIVVSANYRTSLFGFPGLPGMEQNVGLLDQRLAIEWTRKNIAAFGGDPSRITLFGQSAGAASIDYYSYAWAQDPIVNGFIMESGVVNSFFSPAPANNTAAWYSITQKLGCGEASDGFERTIACMRLKSMEDVLAASASVLPMGPTADGKLVLSDYTDASYNGKFAKKPVLLGNNDYEAGIIKVIFGSMGKTMSPEQWAILNLQTFTCPVGSASQYRASNNVPVWRYRYFGEFENTRLTQNPNSGAWHGSEISQVFGSSQLGGLRNTRAEASVSRRIMSAWAAFAKDPDTALSRAPFSWPKYNPTRNTLIQLAYNNARTFSFINPITYDYACPYILKPGGPDMPALNAIKNLTALGGGSGNGIVSSESDENL